MWGLGGRGGGLGFVDEDWFGIWEGCGRGEWLGSCGGLTEKVAERGAFGEEVCGLMNGWLGGEGSGSCGEEVFHVGGVEGSPAEDLPGRSGTGRVSRCSRKETWKELKMRPLDVSQRR